MIGSLMPLKKFFIFLFTFLWLSGPGNSFYYVLKVILQNICMCNNFTPFATP
jgi:hypothetical protein